jgi:serine/threonine-protein kinase
VIHRDIKPENILLQEGVPLVADFGIALAVSAAGGERLTETGLSVGTPAYMSPEQAAGDREVDARSDIYSLACVLYELLVGDPPFTASTAQAVLARHVRDPVPAITTVRSSVPAGAVAALNRALEKAPADRFETAKAFAEGLFGEAAVGEPERKSIVVLPFANLSPDPENEYFADGLTEEIITDLSQIRSLMVISRNSAMQLKNTNKDTKTIGSTPRSMSISGPTSSPGYSKMCSTFRRTSLGPSSMPCRSSSALRSRRRSPNMLLPGVSRPTTSTCSAGTT